MNQTGKSDPVLLLCTGGLFIPLCRLVGTEICFFGLPVEQLPESRRRRGRRVSCHAGTVIITVAAEEMYYLIELQMIAHAALLLNSM